MNTLEERMERLQKQFAEINAMSFAYLEQRMATIPPLVCAADRWRSKQLGHHAIGVLFH
jgi:hypothetical protein